MSGFSADWLALREPADRNSRNRTVLKSCQQHFAGRDAITVCDLGAGTGASVRAFTDLLPPKQRWHLIDGDVVLLDQAQRSLAGRDNITFEQRDFAVQPACWPADTDLVTASALLDLVSLDWIARFVAALAKARIAVLATLTVDGTILNQPALPLDSRVAAAFRSHQEGDKGFGPAAGPWAGGLLAHHLRGAGYVITSGESPWLLDNSRAALRDAYLEGVVNAVTETGKVAGNTLADWQRAAARGTVRIGHLDIFAKPPS